MKSLRLVTVSEAVITQTASSIEAFYKQHLMYSLIHVLQQYLPS